MAMPRAIRAMLYSTRNQRPPGVSHAAGRLSYQCSTIHLLISLSEAEADVTVFAPSFARYGDGVAGRGGTDASRVLRWGVRHNLLLAGRKTCEHEEHHEEGEYSDYITTRNRGGVITS